MVSHLPRVQTVFGKKERALANISASAGGRHRAGGHRHRDLKSSPGPQFQAEDGPEGEVCHCTRDVASVIELNGFPPSPQLMQGHPQWPGVLTVKAGIRDEGFCLPITVC